MVSRSSNWNGLTVRGTSSPACVSSHSAAGESPQFSRLRSPSYLCQSAPVVRRSVTLCVAATWPYQSDYDPAVLRPLDSDGRSAVCRYIRHACGENLAPEAIKYQKPLISGLPHHGRPMMMNQQPLIPDPLEEICG